MSVNSFLTTFEPDSQFKNEKTGGQKPRQSEVPKSFQKRSRCKKEEPNIACPSTSSICPDRQTHSREAQAVGIPAQKDLHEHSLSLALPIVGS